MSSQAVTQNIDPSQGASAPSALSAIVAQPPQQPSQQSPGNPIEQAADGGMSAPPSGGRLNSILSAVAQATSAGLAGISDKGRPGFIQGLGSGARVEDAAQQMQQGIKFKTFDDSVRAAQLHNEDVRMQWADEDHQNAVQANADAQAERMKSTTGMSYTFVPNDEGGKAVLDHMGVQQAQNGSVSVPAGTIAGPKGWYIPNKGSAEQAQANTKDFNARAPFYGFNPAPNGQVVADRAYDQLRQASNGLDAQGHPMHANDLQARVDNMTEQLAKYKEGANADPNTIAAVQSDIDHLTNLQGITDKRETAAVAKATQQKATQASAVEGAKDAAKAANTPDKPQKADAQMYVGSDASGNQIAGTSDDLKAAGAQGVTKLDSDTGKKVIVARQLISPSGLFGQIKQDMLNLDAKGKMGSSATARFNDAMLQKAGSDPDYAPLFVHTHLLSTALMQAHVGSRGSSDMMTEFQKLADAGKMNASTLRSALGAEYNYVHEKAMMPKQQPSQTNNGGGQ